MPIIKNCAEYIYTYIHIVCEIITEMQIKLQRNWEIIEKLWNFFEGRGIIILSHLKFSKLMKNIENLLKFSMPKLFY